MPGGWPCTFNVSRATDQGTDTGSSRGTSVVTGSSANTLGSWTTLIASSAIDSCMMDVNISNHPSGGQILAVDIGIGGSGSEIAIIQRLTIDDCNVGFSKLYTFPISIPAGTRIAARVQSNYSSTDSLTVQVMLYEGSFTQPAGCAMVDTYGFVAGSTSGTTIDPGATANTKGSYVQLTASSSYDLCGFSVALDSLGQSPSDSNSADILVDVAIGGSGSEVVILPNVQYYRMIHTSTTQVVTASPFWPIAIPSGTRIAIRAQSSVNASPDRLFGATFYGVRG